MRIELIRLIPKRRSSEWPGPSGTCPFMRSPLKLTLYRASKRTGLFDVARKLTAGRLRILCFHGFSLGDEHRFSPGVFMRGDVVRDRIEWLLRNGFPILGLQEALDGLSRGTLPPCSTVVTFDDGFYS